MPDIRHSLQISASPETIYPLVSIAAGLAQRWAADVQENGGAIDLGFFNRTTVYRLRPTVQSRPRRFCVKPGNNGAGRACYFDRNPREVARWCVSPTQVWLLRQTISCLARRLGGLMFRLKAAGESKPRGPLSLAGSLAY